MLNYVSKRENNTSSSAKGQPAPSPYVKPWRDWERRAEKLADELEALRRENERLAQIARDDNEVLQEVIGERNRYRAALERIEGLCIVGGDGFERLIRDIARDALAGEQG